MFRYYSKVDEAPVRVTVVGDYNGGVLQIAAARCGKKDRFERKKGRYIAEERLDKGKLFISIKMDECTSARFVEIARRVVEHVAETRVVEHVAETKECVLPS